MRSRKSNILSKVHKIPEIKFEKQQLTSYSGLIIFQNLFSILDLRKKLKYCFKHQRVESFYRLHNIFILLIVHVLIGFKRLRGRDYYFDDPIVKRVIGLNTIPDVSTISRSLIYIDDQSIENIKKLNTEIVTERLNEENLRTITIDFDGFVVSTQGKIEDSAMGYNKKKKGARSYYPLGCTVAQTGQVLGLLHRPGNVHDSNQAEEFILENIKNLKLSTNCKRIETRIDSAFFSDQLIFMLDDEKVEFSVSVPFARFAELKKIVESRKRFLKIDDTWSYFEQEWSPKSWGSSFRILVYRKKQAIKEKGPLQLDMFEPVDHEYQYKVVMTNKNCNAKKLLHYHNGRGYQEGIYAELKSDSVLDYLPFKRKIPNITYSMAGIFAHNLSKELQMRTLKKHRGSTEKRSALWIFESLSTLRNKLIINAGKISKPQGQLSLTLNDNIKTKSLLMKFLNIA